MHFNAATRVATLQHGTCTLAVDATLLPEFDFRIGSLFEFIGTVQVAGLERRVAARAHRNVDGLDMALYENVLRVRRAFLRTLSSEGGRAS
ncbi:telomere-capping, CST complex subunit-domain-containing protein [Tribonema minus]|uniref:Telomere-capping, CST complex subunit-domain-containing protein n=1 Tax=Tribonema minus TaxID=303371 RepID=A0A835ZB80_9STRA|nr:telomere-capping, CST complex subunit-domain-containing protein [Tribonema minus]